MKSLKNTLLSGMSDVLSIANFISFSVVLEFPFLSKIIYLKQLRFVIFLLLGLCKDLFEEEYFLQ